MTDRRYRRQADREEDQSSRTQKKKRQTEESPGQRERRWCDASAINFITCKQKRAAIFIYAGDYAGPRNRPEKGVWARALGNKRGRKRGTGKSTSSLLESSSLGPNSLMWSISNSASARVLERRFVINRHDFMVLVDFDLVIILIRLTEEVKTELV